MCASTFYHPAWSYNWKGVRPELKRVVLDISNMRLSSELFTRKSGSSKSRDKAWLMKNATRSELEKLMSYPNGVIKATAYHGLLIRNDTDASEVLKMALSDTTHFIFLDGGCVSHPKMVGEYMMEDVLGIGYLRPPPIQSPLKRFNLTRTELEELKVLYNDLRKMKWHHFKHRSI